MDASSAQADILVAATQLDERIFQCLADYSARLVRTFEDAKRALREQVYRLIVIDLNFDNVRTFDLLQYVRSLADFAEVPVVCLQAAEADVGFSAALDRLVRSLGGRAFVDLRGEGEKSAQAFEHLCQIVAIELGAQHAKDAGQPLCVLIIERDCDAAHRLGNLLEGLGHDVDYAYNTAAGLDATQRLRPDVVFLGLGFPGIDDVQLARELRHACNSSHPYVVGFANGPGDQKANTALDAVIAEPINPLRLQKLLRSVR